MADSNASENTYIFGVENASEIARLLERNTFLDKAMGGPFPERTDLDGITHILDIGCGPGGWAIDVARRYPSIKVVGIDTSETMIASARNEAQKASLLENVTFVRMNALHPLEFPDQHFDLVNMRAAVEFIPRDYWQPLLQECYRVTQSGGILRLMEADRIAHTNSRAFEQYHAFYARMLYLRGYGFSPDGQTLGITPMLGKMLQYAGYRSTRMKSYALDLSSNSLFQTHYRRLLELRFAHVRDQLLERGLATSEELERIHYAFLGEISRETFCAVAYPLIFWGEK